MEKQSPKFSYNSTSHLSCQYCSMDVRAQRGRRIWRSESRPLKTNTTGECLTYHTDSIKQTNMYGNRPVSSSDVRSFYRQLPCVACYRCSAMSVFMICSRKSYYINERGQYSSQMKSSQIMKGQHQGMDRPVDVVIAAHRG